MKPKREHDPEFQKAVRQLSCILCGKSPPSTVSHIKTRGSGGGDEYYNCVPKCLDCHRFWEDNKEECLTKYPHFADYLESLGWEWQTVHGKFYLRHPEP